MPYSSRNLLVVDDDRNVCSVLCRMLGRILPGITVHPCYSAADALALAQHLALDCVVTDYKLGDSDGITLTRMLHELQPDLPIVLISGLLAATLSEEATNAGCVAVLTKPIGFAVLRETILPLLSPLEIRTAEA